MKEYEEYEEKTGRNKRRESDGKGQGSVFPKNHAGYLKDEI